MCTGSCWFFFFFFLNNWCDVYTLWNFLWKWAHILLRSTWIPVALFVSDCRLKCFTNQRHSCQSAGIQAWNLNLCSISQICKHIHQSLQAFSPFKRVQTQNSGLVFPWFEMFSEPTLQFYELTISFILFSLSEIERVILAHARHYQEPGLCSSLQGVASLGFMCCYKTPTAWKVSCHC